MSNQATGASRKDIGRKTIVNGYAGKGVVLSVKGRTVEVEFPFGKVSVGQDKICLIPQQ